ncbi:MAG: SdrD B-like domain-containing protein, partial [Chloroflexota bacterium]
MKKTRNFIQYVVFSLMTVLSLVVSPLAHAATVTGTVDPETAGVWLFSAGGDAGSCLSPTGLPGALPTDDVVQTAVNFDILEFVGDVNVEVDNISPGPSEGNESSRDSTVAQAVEGLSEIDDFGLIANGNDNNANYDMGSGGSFEGGLRGSVARIIVADGVVATGTVGPETSTNAADADTALGGYEIFIFEDAELSGMSVRLSSPTNNILFEIDDRQVNPDSSGGADDTMIAIDLDALPGFDGTYIDTIEIVDDGVAMTNSPCPTHGDTSAEIDAIAVRKSVIRTALDVEKEVSVDNQATWQDADNITGPIADIGDDVFFRFTATNNSIVSLNNISLTDSDFSTASCSVPSTMAGGDSFSCVIGPFSAVEGQHQNTASLSGNFVGGSFADQDDAHYLGVFPGCRPSLDFETNGALAQLTSGQIIDDEYAHFGIQITTNDPVNHPAMIFDSSAPTGGDPDLGTANQDFAGPGIGDGGRMNMPGENNTFRDNILIISEDGDQNDPDDKGSGGTIIFTFDEPLQVDQVEIVDIDDYEIAGTVTAYDAGNNVITVADVLGLGNNSAQTINVNATGVSRLEVYFPGSGSISNVNFCSPTTHPTYTLGDLIWNDLDGDGVQTGNEPGLNNVVLELYAAGFDFIIDTTTTDTDGSYQFSGLPNGSYEIKVADSNFEPSGALNGFVFSPANVTTDDLDSDFNSASSRAPAIVANASDDTIDGGLYDPQQLFGSIGDRVWLDDNGDGAQNNGEVGLANVTVNLVDGTNAVVDTDTTDGDGDYLFDDVAPGAYTVKIDTNTLPANVRQSYDADGLGTLNQSALTLAPGADRLDQDFGYQRLGSIGDRVWSDDNGDGNQSGESGINGVTVLLLTDGGVEIDSDITAGDGNYQFDDVAMGSYIVKIDTNTLPANVQPTFDADGLGSANQSSLTLDAGQTNLDQDFGYQTRIASIDIEKSTNDQDADSPTGPALIVGVDVTWKYDVTNTGDYDLVNIIVSDDNEGQICTIASLPKGASETCMLVGTAQEGQYSNVGSVVGEPVDGNGQPAKHPNGVSVASPTDQDSSHYLGFVPGQASVDIEKYTNNVDADTPTGPEIAVGDPVQWSYEVVNNGNYDLVNVVVTDDVLGQICTIASLPQGASDTCTANGTAQEGQYTNLGSVTADPVDGNGDPATNPDGSPIASPSDTDRSHYLGFIPVGTIGDRIWFDDNGDGSDSGEAGMPNVTVRLLNSSNEVVDSETTGPNGDYLFEDIVGGSYTVVVDTNTLPNNVRPSYDADGTGSANQSSLTLAPGADNLDQDFGYQRLGSIGDRVWFDDNGNQTQDDTESGINSVTVRLLDSNSSEVALDITEGDGDYLFEDIPMGDYTIVIDGGTLPANIQQTFDADGLGTLNQSAISFSAGETNLDQDFGYQRLGSIGDRVWSDDNGNGVQDGGEAGIVGVTVLLRASNGDLIDTDVTETDGIYGFAGLPQGDYIIEVSDSSLPGNVTQTYDLDGILDHQTTISLAAGQNTTEADFGYQPLGQIGDRVWFDINGDGVQDDNEDGIQNVFVRLLNSSNEEVDIEETDGNGNYTFDDVPLGDYTIVIDTATLPDDVQQTFDADGLGTLNQSALTLNPGQTNLDQDFGYQVRIASIDIEKSTNGLDAD